MAKKTHILFPINRAVVALVLVGSLAGSVTGRATAGLLTDWFSGGGETEVTETGQMETSWSEVAQQDDIPQGVASTGFLWNFFSWFDGSPVTQLTPTVEVVEPVVDPFVDCTVTRSDTDEQIKAGGVVSFHGEVTFVLSGCGDGQFIIGNEVLGEAKNSAVATDDGIIFVRAANGRVIARAPADEDIDAIVVVGAKPILVSAISSEEQQVVEEAAAEEAVATQAPDEDVDATQDVVEQVALPDVNDLPWMKNFVQTAIQDEPHAAAPAFVIPTADKYCANPNDYPEITWFNCPVTTMGFANTDPNNMPYGLVPAGSVKLQYDYPWMRNLQVPTVEPPSAQPVIYTNAAGQTYMVQPTGTTTTTVVQPTGTTMTQPTGTTTTIVQPTGTTTTTLSSPTGTTTTIVQPPIVMPLPVPPTTVPKGGGTVPVSTACESLQCPGTCNDTEDNDGDGNIDGRDPKCVLHPAANCESILCLAACSDTEDNDNNGSIDGMDPKCRRVEAARYVGSCTDGVDNDSNNAPDGADSKCLRIEMLQSPVSCNDGEDNDGNGMTDGNDPKCRTSNISASASATTTQTINTGTVAQ